MKNEKKTVHLPLILEESQWIPRMYLRGIGWNLRASATLKLPPKNSSIVPERQILTTDQISIQPDDVIRGIVLLLLAVQRYQTRQA